jgi:hypothetical protein
MNRSMQSAKAGLLILAAAFAATIPWEPAALAGRSVPTQARMAEDHMSRAKVFLAAGDYRHALQACELMIQERPSAAGYVYLTYVYQAIDGYLEHLAKTDQWILVDQLYFNLAYRDPQDLVDPPGGMARMAKEMIQTSVRQQADVSAAMATRLDKSATEQLWQQQTAWRQSNPDRWWAGAPAGWDW